MPATVTMSWTLLPKTTRGAEAAEVVIVGAGVAGGGVGGDDGPGPDDADTRKHSPLVVLPASEEAPYALLGAGV